MQSLLNICLKYLAQNLKLVRFDLLPSELIDAVRKEIAFELFGGKVAVKLVTNTSVLLKILIKYDCTNSPTVAQQIVDYYSINDIIIEDNHYSEFVINI